MLTGSPPFHLKNKDILYKQIIEVHKHIFCKKNRNKNYLYYYRKNQYIQIIYPQKYLIYYKIY